MLSDYCEEIKSKYDISIGQVHNLIPTLSNKENMFYIKKSTIIYGFKNESC